MARDNGPAPKFFAAPAAFRAWLEKHAATHAELIVGFHKVGSGKPCMTWPESVDEALCFGWIDGVRTRIDAESYKIRFTPRRPGSIWSAVNIAKVEALTAAGRMTPAGLAAFAKRTAKKSAVYAFEQRGELALPAPAVKAFQRHKAAWTYFESTPPSYRKVVIHWVNSAKQDETRERRLQQLIEACKEQRRLR
ncbi:MAG: YdeI/OmpD-associated family protein [Betaproteobacteria bacterium]|nr:YdeI/OmpD-associated family protein [Betaproteobacteria bacterium]